MNLTSGWLDAITERADLPQLTDIGGALIVFNNLTCSDYSLHAFRRFPIPYQLFGRERRYRVADVVGYARRCLEEAPVRVPPQRPRRKRIRPATPGPNPRRPNRVNDNLTAQDGAQGCTRASLAFEATLRRSIPPTPDVTNKPKRKSGRMSGAPAPEP